MSQFIPYQESSENTLLHFTSSKEGLAQTSIEERQKIYGQNKLQETQKVSKLIKFMSQFKDVLIILLLASTVISLYLEDYKGATILGVIVLVNALIGYFQEAKAEKIMESLKSMLHPCAKVKRDNKLIEVQADELVPGDIIYIEEGDSIPADMRIFEHSELQVNDFSLTGESNPVAKFTHAIQGDVLLAERNNSVFMGTTVATGYARGIVIATGMNTELGRIANLSSAQDNDISPLQKEMKNIATKLTIGTLILVVALLIITLAAHFSIREAFLFAIGISAAMVPQGLPAQVNIALSLATKRLAKQKALIKKLSSVETLGSVNIICTDKTGTLTKNEMTVKTIRSDNILYNVSGDGYEPLGEITPADRTQDKQKLLENPKLQKLLQACIFASNATNNPPDSEHNSRYCLGDPTEGALVSLAIKSGITPSIRQEIKQEHQFGFDSVRKMMSSIRNINNETVVFVKGAPNILLEHCNISQEEKEKILTTIEGYSAQAMRVLAFAYKQIPTYTPNLTMQEVESDLLFLGFVCMIDPPREEVAFAIQNAKDAKINIIMITGDYGTTAQAIGHRIGLDINDVSQVINGDELKNMSEITLTQILTQQKQLIFSRTSPEDKLRIVNLLKKMNYVIAVTGDGINDAPALKAADIGVAMGKIGTDVAKEASEMVLLDDSFHTLVNAIQEGRIIYENLKKTIISCITSNGGELFAVLTSLLMKALYNIPMAINPVQILAIDLIGEMGPLTALTRDPAQKDLMKQGPRDTKKHVINKYMIIDLIWSGALMGFLGYAAYLFYLRTHNISAGGLNENLAIYASANSITYVTIMFCQYANIFSRRAGVTTSMFSSYLRSNKKLLRSIGLGLVCILFLVYSPIGHIYFKFGSFEAIDRLFPLAGGVIFMLVREGYKFFARKHKWIEE